MFNIPDNFYPTPQPIIDKMLQGIKWEQVETILEPSAGKGDLAKGIIRAYNLNNYRRSRKCDIDCIELDKNLQQVLKYEFSRERKKELHTQLDNLRRTTHRYYDRGDSQIEIDIKVAESNFKLVGDDFLNFETFKKYDYIIANPPFDNGDKHLLKMIEMQKRTGGKIICLLNAETIRNPYTAVRKDLINQLTDLNADIEFIEDGFKTAERRTDVEIALIKIDVPEPKLQSFIFKDLKQKEFAKEQEINECNALAENDFLRQIVKMYEFEAQAGINLINEFRAIKPYILSDFDTEGKSNSILNIVFYGSGRTYDNVTPNEYLKLIRRKYWKQLFTNEKFVGTLTSNLREQLMSRVDELCDYDFSLYNIYSIQVEISQSMIKGVEDTILNLFEEFSYKHSWYDETSKNTHYYNGWKTNKAYIINKKVIIPLQAFNTSWKGEKYLEMSRYNFIKKMRDIEKVFNYLDDGSAQTIDLHTVLKAAEENNQTKQIDTKYFMIDVYKKGTTHITFKNLDLLAKFNLFGSQRKGWLPPTYGKKAYKNMTTEEKAVIDEFQGEKEYNRIMQNKEYFMFDSKSILALPEVAQE